MSHFQGTLFGQTYTDPKQWGRAVKAAKLDTQPLATLPKTPPRLGVPLLPVTDWTRALPREFGKSEKVWQAAKQRFGGRVWCEGVGGKSVWYVDSNGKLAKAWL